MSDEALSGPAPSRAPVAPAVAGELFGDRLGIARAYADLLASDGVLRGLIGPREVPRLWDRHLLNCAVLTDLLPPGARIADIGSGAGLPGIVLAIRRPDLVVTLVEPMQRRADFLHEAVTALAIGPQIQVVRGRAEDAELRRRVGPQDSVVARAVAPLDRLVKWCLPLVRTGGRLFALKGARAADEVAEHRSALRRAGAGEITVTPLGAGVLEEPTWVVEVERAAVAGSRRRQKGSR